MQQPHVLVVCPTSTDRRELNTPQFTEKYHIHFQEYDDTVIEKILCKVEGVTEIFEPEKIIDGLFHYCLENAIDAVVSTEDYPGCLLASAICQRLGMIGPSPESVLACQHKYYSRVLQKQCVPEAVPEFGTIDPQVFDADKFDMPFPLFIKPVKSKFSIFANQVANTSELQMALKNDVPSDLFLTYMDWFVQHYAPFVENPHHLLAETLLQGEQITLEGYVYKGEVFILGIVDSIMFPGTICFERFHYPSHLPWAIQQRMANIATLFIQHVGLNNCLFNIEMMYDAHQDRIYIIEVNPRMSFQFADLFEKVDGTNSYAILIDIALGRQPKMPKFQGEFNVASSFVLRRFQNARVISAPTAEHVNNLKTQFPDARIELFVSQDQSLDSFKQDGKSFRYGLVNIGAHNEHQLSAKYEACKQHLVFKFD